MVYIRTRQFEPQEPEPKPKVNYVAGLVNLVIFIAVIGGMLLASLVIVELMFLQINHRTVEEVSQRGTWLEELGEGEGEWMNWKSGCNFDRPSVLQASTGEWFENGLCGGLGNEGNEGNIV